MIQTAKEKYSSPFFFSVLLHVVAVALLIVSFSFSSKMPVLENSNKTNVINAMVMTSIPMPAKVIPHPQQVIPKLTTTIKPKPIKQEVKPTPIVPPKKQAIAISDKKEKKRQQDKIAQQLLADIKKETHQQKKIKQKAIAAEFAKELNQLTAKSIQRQMRIEQKQMTGALSQQAQGEVNKYKALVLQAISQHWIIPPGVNKNLSAELMIRIAPGGTVLDVQVVRSSGDESLDRSAQSAVFKASPLPVPLDSKEFEPFRHFALKVRPKDILGPDSWTMK